MLPLAANSHAWWRIQTIPEVMQAEVRAIVDPILGAVIGAAFGSVGRYRRARRQGGFAIGLCVGDQLDVVPLAFPSVSLVAPEADRADVRWIAPRLDGTESLYVRKTQISEDGLMELAQGPKLQRIKLINCRAVTADGLHRFPGRRPDVDVRAENGLTAVELTAQRPGSR